MPRLSPCAEIVRRLDYDRFVTTLFAPPPEREALAVLYAFNTEVARIRESVREPLIGHMRLKWWHDTLDAVIAGAPPRHEVAAPLADVVRRYRLPRAPFDALIEARATDLDDEAPATLAALERYAEGTSATLTGLALDILGVRDEAARAAGREVAVAWALVGTVRAVPFQARMERSMLPHDLCRAAGVTARQRLAAPAAPEVRTVIRTLTARAAERLAAARAVRGEVPGEALPALLPGAIAEGYLKRLRAAAYDPHDRRVQHPPTPPRLLRTAAAALRGRY